MTPCWLNACQRANDPVVNHEPEDPHSRYDTTVDVLGACTLSKHALLDFRHEALVAWKRQRLESVASILLVH